MPATDAELARQLEKLVKEIRKKSRYKRGLVSVDCAFHLLEPAELESVLYKLGVPNASSLASNPAEAMAAAYTHLFEEYLAKGAQGPEEGAMAHVGAKVFEAAEGHLLASDFDFPTKQELVEAFADWCADLGITVFDARRSGADIDLYLTKKATFASLSEVAIVRTGRELEVGGLSEFLESSRAVAKLADWLVWVTSPAGVLVVGLDDLVGAAERAGAWLYVLDPRRRWVFGVVKGRNAPELDERARTALVARLPDRPLRGPSKVRKFSNYSFSERESYKPEQFGTFEVAADATTVEACRVPRSAPHVATFRGLIVMDVEAQVAVYSLFNEEHERDAQIISGFVAALDSFVGEIAAGEPATLRSIQYRGFTIHATTGRMVRGILFLTAPPPPDLVERLGRFVEEFERRFEVHLKRLRESGRAAAFDEHAAELDQLAKTTLGV